MIGCFVVGIFLILKMVKKFGKKKIVMIGFIVGVIVNGLNFILLINIYLFIIFVIIGYVVLVILNGVIWVFVLDVIDYGEWYIGIRKEGIIYVVFNFLRKIV